MHKVRRTKLAMKAGINYTACNRYVAWLAKVNWVSVQDGEIGLTKAVQRPHTSVHAPFCQSVNKNPFL
jgi:hypothetical protein